MKNGFLGFEGAVNFQSPLATAKTVVVPFGMELTVSYGKGTARGPKAIIEASHQLEKIDEQTFLPAYRCGVATLTEPKIPNDPKQALELLKKITKQVLKNGKFPLILGGEHSLTFGSLAAVCEAVQNVSVLQFDAHTDLRESFRGTIYSHGAVMHQSLKNLPIRHLTQVGIRSISDSDNELAFWRENQKKITTFWAWKKLSIAKILASIPTKNVYLTFDLDFLENGDVPATGTPEPGGLPWWPTLELLKEVFAKKNVVGCDVVELAPVKNLHASNYLAARLAYKMIGYKFR
ncbi:MAG: agmatinase [Patescibacteria group bacterium]